MHCDLWPLPCSFSVFFPLHHCFLAKNINKTIELLKYKIYQKARRNRPKEQSNFSIVLRFSIVLGIRRICCCLDKFWAKACKIAEKKLEKDEDRNTKNTEKGNKI
jgi:hypothetical protein